MVYNWYISGIYCQLGDCMLQIPPFRGTISTTIEHTWILGDWMQFPTFLVKSRRPMTPQVGSGLVGVETPGHPSVKMIKKDKFLKIV